MLLLLTGCSTLKDLPAGSQIQSSTFGIRFSPGAADGTPFVLGSHTSIATLPQPADAGPNLNRFEGRAPFSIRVKSTVATGAVGQELQAAGPALGGILKAENTDTGDTFLPPRQR